MAITPILACCVVVDTYYDMKKTIFGAPNNDPLPQKRFWENPIYTNTDTQYRAYTTGYRPWTPTVGPKHPAKLT